MLLGDDAWKLEETKNMNCPMFSPFVADAEIKAFSPCTKHSISGLSENVCAFFSLNPSRTSLNILTDLYFPSLPLLLSSITHPLSHADQSQIPKSLLPQFIQSLLILSLSQALQPKKTEHHQYLNRTERQIGKSFNTISQAA